MSPPAVTVECSECGAPAPQKAGISSGVLLAAAHVRLDVVGRPCSVERLRRGAAFTLTAAQIWECRELWEDVMAEEAAALHLLEIPEVIYPNEHDIPDPENWTGACRADGVSW